MALFQRLFFAVLLAGLISGAAMAALQQWRVVPLIDPEQDEQDEPPDPVRLVQGGTLPKDVVDQLRQSANAVRLHIYVHPAV